MDVALAGDLLALAREVERHARGPAAADWTARLDARFDELPAAVDALIAAGATDDALALVGSLSRYAQQTGRVREVREIVDRTLERAGDAPARGRALLTSGELAFRQGDQEAAARATEAALAAADALRDSPLAARAHMNLARVAFRDGDAQRIQRHAERMLELADGDAALLSGAVHMLGWAAYTAGDVRAAMRRFEENVDDYRRAGDREGMAAELGNLGELALETGDRAGAAAFLREALGAAGDSGSRYLLPSLLASAALLAGSDGRHEDCLLLGAAAEAQYDAAGLIADPGGGVPAEVREEAAARVGADESSRLQELGRSLSLEEAVRTAAASLTATVGRGSD